MHTNERVWLRLTPGLLFVGACLSGCVTADTLDSAKARTHINEKHEVVIDQPARPGYYGLLPLSIAADTALLPVYVVAIVAVNLGIMRPP